MINYDPSHFLLQQMDYLAFSDLYHGRIKAFHVKDAEFNHSLKASFNMDSIRQHGIVRAGFISFSAKVNRCQSLSFGAMFDSDAISYQFFYRVLQFV